MRVLALIFKKSKLNQLHIDMLNKLFSYWQVMVHLPADMVDKQLKAMVVHAFKTFGSLLYKDNVS